MDLWNFLPFLLLLSGLTMMFDHDSDDKLLGLLLILGSIAWLVLGSGKGAEVPTGICNSIIIQFC